MTEHRRGGVVTARVVGQPEQPVGVDRVGAVRLQRVGAHLVGEPDAAPFLAQIEDGAEAAPRDLGLRRLELVFAVALQRPEDLARDAFGVNAHGHVGATCHVAHAEGHVLVGQAGVGLAGMITKYLHFEVTMARRKRRSGEHFELRPDLLDGDVHLALL